MLITDTLGKWASLKPGSIAILTKTEQFTFEELNQKVNRLSSYFQSQDKSNLMKKVVLLLPNTVSFLHLFLGATKAGWVAVPFDIKWTRKEIQDRLDQCSPNLIVTNQEFYQKVFGLSSSIILLSELDQILDESEYHSSDIKINEEAPFYMGFTSGSTGTAKCFIRSHKSWVKSFDCSATEFGITHEDRILVPGPLAHSLFLYAAISTLFLGGSITLMEKFSVSETFEHLTMSNITTLYVVPTMFVPLVKEAWMGHDRQKLIRLISSGAKWEEGLKQKVRNQFQEAQLYEFYGASELSFVSYLENQGNEQKTGSVGKPFHNVEISIRKDGRDVDVGEVGLLYVKSDMIFMEYYQNQSETNRIFDNGWATVGDLAKQDEDGFLTIIGRENNMIITGGLNVYPEEIESVLYQMEEIEEVMILGMPDDYWGEKIVAIVKTKSNQILKKQFMTSYCRMQLANYKVPRTYHFVNSFPYTSNGKIARAELKECLIRKEQLK